MSITKLSQNDNASYPKRLEAVRELGKLFPGFLLPLGHKHRSLGLFAGIYLQTKWQYDSHRDEIPLWFFVNQSLTLAPLAYAKEFLVDANTSESKYVKNHQTRDVSHAPITQDDTCRAWKTYFQACTKNASSVQLSRLLWKAHTTAIRFSLWQYASEFEDAHVPKEEIAFWQGWIRLVLGLETIAPFTNDVLLQPLLSLTMPRTSPLGDKDAQILKQPLFRCLFLLLIMRKAAPMKSFLERYGRKR